jgi:hypothetical protein
MLCCLIVGEAERRQRLEEEKGEDNLPGPNVLESRSVVFILQVPDRKIMKPSSVHHH